MKWGYTKPNAMYQNILITLKINQFHSHNF